MTYSMDHFLKIGDSHKICEDYSWSGLIQEKYPCAIISDGCSSSKNTDIGARILVRSMIDTLGLLKLERNTPEDNFNLITGLMADRVQRIRDLMGLPMESLDATLLMTILINDYVFMFSYGDGSIVMRNHTTGEKIRFYTDYPHNAPYYYNYTLNEDCKMAFIAAYGQTEITQHGMQVPMMEHLNDRSNHWGSNPLSDLSDGVWTISVMSDGVETFFEGNNNVDTDEAIEGLTNFKNFRGEYIQRKVGKYLSGLAKNNIKHYDDISVASIKFEVNNEQS